MLLSAKQKALIVSLSILRSKLRALNNRHSDMSPLSGVDIEKMRVLVREIEDCKKNMVIVGLDPKRRYSIHTPRLGKRKFKTRKRSSGGSGAYGIGPTAKFWR